MMSPEEIARYYRDKGEEVTPDEIRADIRSIAAKFRAVIPGLPDDDEELLKIVTQNAQIVEDNKP